MVLVFDLFGVLLTSGVHSSKRQLARLLNCRTNRIEAAYRKWEVPFDLGEIDEQHFWKMVNHELGRSIDWRTLNDTVLQSYKPIPGSFELVERYSEVSPLFLLSNTRREWFRVLDSRFNISHHFKKTFLSYELGLRKPDPRIFSSMVNDLRVHPSDVFYLDDEAANIKSAASLGILGNTFESPFEAEVDLHARLTSKPPAYGRTYAGVVLISDEGEVILQKREDRPGVSNPGLITTFGGIRKPNESFEDCAIREVSEELSIQLNPKQLQFLTKLSKPENDQTWTACNFFTYSPIDPSRLSLSEGESIQVFAPKSALRSKFLSPVCRVVIRHYLQHVQNE